MGESETGKTFFHERSIGLLTSLRIMSLFFCTLLGRLHGAPWGGRSYLLLALVCSPLTTHPFRDGAPFLLRIETPPTFARSLRFFHILHINCSLILSPPFLAFCGGAERDRREGEGWRQRESSTLHRNEALQPLCTDDSSSPSLCMDRRSLSDLFRRMVALSLSCCR